MKKKWIPVALATMITIPTAAFAAETGATESPQVSEKVEKFVEATPILKAHGKFGGHFIKHLGMDEQQEQKLLELVKKYDPESTEEWQKTIDERQELLAELRELNPKDFLKEKREEIIKEREAKLDELLDQLVSGKITKEEFKQKLKEARDNRKEQLKQWKDEKLPIAKEVVEKERELHKQFREAVKSEDEKAIVELLPKFLEHLQTENDRLAQIIEKIKENQTTNEENGL
jgi:Glu-tRNA(Gln) amidotransferase subunit E-like FAD-binding protein